jgi:type I restriction enzyme, S subunit
MKQRLESIPLGELSEIVTKGTTPTTLGKPFVENGVRFLRVQNIQDGKVNFSKDDLFIDDETNNLLNRSKIKVGDLLITIAGTIGRTAIVHTTPERLNCNQAVAIVRLKDSVHRPFIRYWLESSEAKNQIANSQVTATISNLSLSQVRNLKIPLPPLEQQRRIAAILDKADELRSKRRQAIEKLEQLLQSVFLELFGDPVTNPKGWDECHLGEVADIASGVAKGRKFGSKDTVEVPYMRVANVQDEHIILNDVKTIEVLPEEVNKYALMKGDILLTEGGDPDKLGRGAIWHGEIKPCIHQNHIFRVRVKNNNLLPQFISPLIGSQRGKRYFLSAAKQTTGIATINMGQLKRFPILLPPIALQKKHFELSQSIESKLLIFEKSLNKLDKLFHSLQHRAFRGEL